MPSDCHNYLWPVRNYDRLEAIPLRHSIHTEIVVEALRRDGGRSPEHGRIADYLSSTVAVKSHFVCG